MPSFFIAHRRTLLIAEGVIFVLLALAAFLHIWRPQTTLAQHIARCDGEGTRKQQCYGELVLSEANAKGIGAGLDALGALYVHDQEFASYCHGNTHELGKMAYTYFVAGKDISLSPKTSYCGFGFFHGFIEELMSESGDLSQARKFCEYVDSKLQSELKGTSFACYHGIGHGVVDGTDTAKWGNASLFIADGLRICETLGDTDQHSERCASGVFNALAIAYMDPKYRLSANPKDPFAICRLQDKPIVRKACYDQMNGYVDGTSATFRDALNVTYKTAEAAYAEVAIHSVAAYESINALAMGGDLLTYVKDCGTLPENLSTQCAQGFAEGLIETGKPGAEYVSAIDACARSGTLAHTCFHGVATSVHDRLPGAQQDAACTEIGKAGGQ